MEKQVLLDVLEKHRKWLEGERGGKRADLQGADLQDSDLQGADLFLANLQGANLQGANLQRAGLRSADLQCANLEGTDLRGADLQNANLQYANLQGADLRFADLQDANLRLTDLQGADLRGANLQRAGLECASLQDANLQRADLRFTDLQNVDLRDADLCGTNLWATNLSGAKGIKLAADYIKENFEQTADGIIAYKTFGTFNNPNPNWEIKPGAVIEENVDFHRTNECGCGINVGTLEWVRENSPREPIWKCLIRWIDLADVVVPYNTDGKIRAGRVQLLEIVEEEA